MFSPDPTQSDCSSAEARSPGASRDAHTRSARLPEPLRQELLDRLDRHASAEEALRHDRANKREDLRLPYRQNDIEVTVEHPAGGVSRLLLCSRNLSPGGIAFIHGGFIYPRSRAKLMLIRLDGQVQLITGTFVSCRHVQGLLHEIGLKFDKRIDPRQFVRQAVGHHAPLTDTVELNDLHGRVLLVDPSPADRALLAYHLRSSSINIAPVTTPGAALDAVKQQIVDIILTELHVDGHDGVDLIARLRETRFRGPIVVITAEIEPGHIARAREAGAGHVLIKPYAPDDLHKLMIQLHRKVGAVLTHTALYSTIHDQPEMEPLIAEYVDQTKRAAVRLGRCIADNNLPDARQACLMLKGSAAGYGFPQLGAAAAEALHTLDASHSVRQASAQLRTLCMLCDRLRSRNRRFEQPAAA